MKAFSFLLEYIKDHLWILLAAVLSMLALVALELVAPWIIRDMVAIVSSGLQESGALRRIGRLALLALAVYGGRTGLQFLRSYLTHVAGWGVVASVRIRIYQHLQRLSFAFYEDKQTGQLMSRMVNDSDMFERLISHAIPDLAVNILSLIGVSIVLLNINARLMLLSMIPIPLIVIAMRGFAKYVRPAFVTRQKELGDLNATLNDNLSGMREIQSFTREDREARRIGTRIHAYKGSLLKALRLMATFHPFVSFASSLGTVGLIYFGGRLAVQQLLPIEDLVAFFLYLAMFYSPIMVLSSAWENIQESLAGADRVAELLNERPSVQDRPGARSLTSGVEGNIEIDDVSFKYARGETVLEGIALSIPARSSLALVGPTGVGKTTLVSLLPRFYDVCSGSIRVDGTDIRDLTLSSLRRQISIVSQDVFLFHGTVRDNILFGSADPSDDGMRHAAGVANADEFVAQLPDGYDTFIGERGVKLSGGQKQRIAIARAILKDAPILILDEATSSVDTHTELLIQEALEHLMTDRTAIIIAHRLSTVRNADVIAVLEGTGIAELGTHEELLRRGGLYRHLIEIQSRVHSAPELTAWEIVAPE